MCEISCASVFAASTRCVDMASVGSCHNDVSLNVMRPQFSMAATGWEGIAIKSVRDWD